jgi:hypothetical protein
MTNEEIVEEVRLVKEMTWRQEEREQAANGPLFALAQEVLDQNNQRGISTPYEWCLVLANCLGPFVGKMVKQEREACAQFLAKQACIYLLSRDSEPYPSEQWARFDAIAHMLEEMGKAIRARSS